LDVSTIGTQYLNFGMFAKGGKSTWTLTNTTSAVTVDCGASFETRAVARSSG
jgi:hypothetical protein